MNDQSDLADTLQNVTATRERGGLNDRHDRRMRRSMRIAMLFEPRDLWIGVYWKTYTARGDDGRFLRRWTAIYVCLVPMLPIKVSIIAALEGASVP